jgi:hypothetical protein
MDALIGHTGFVGTTLLRQRGFDALYRSTDIGQIEGRQFGAVVCAGAPAQKWIAERDPAADIANIEALARHLDAVEAEQFILISTVDVFPDSRGANESTPIEAERLTAYGKNRLWLERHVTSRFARSLIVRLPGLVGPGLRKNAVFDFLNDNNLHAIDHRGVFQFYPMVNLWADLQLALGAGLSVVHLPAEPLSIREVAEEGFGRPFENVLERPPASYDLQTQHAAVFGGEGVYAYSKRESLMAIRAYAQSEPLTAIKP